MLLQLHVENFALAKNLTLEFDSKLNVLTGETGAGKSILIDAIRFVLGERADQVRISTSEKSCVVEAVFEIPASFQKKIELFDSLMSSEDDVLTLRREYQSSGKSRVWINQRIANVSALKEVGAYLLDIHGQYDHQRLFDKRSHGENIDRLGKLEKLKSEYALLYQQFRGFDRKKQELLRMQEGREREMDLLKYQIDELERVSLQEGEMDELNTERIRLANSEKLYALVTEALKVLDEEDLSVSPMLGKASREIEELVKFDDSIEPMKSEFENAQYKIEDTIRELRNYQESLSFDPDRLIEIDQRLDEIEHIHRKYGGGTQAALQFLAEAKEKYDKLLNSGLYENELESEMAKILPKVKKLAEELTAQRKKVAAKLKKVIESELKDLRIQDACFECKIEKKEFSETGQDEIEFLMSLNKGEPLRELRKIASGGEASRVMLAMKKALMNVDPVPTLIFDEIDANIGGRLGTVTGEKLKEIAAERQVLLVTHLPQIASFATRHFKVEKRAHEGKSITEYLTLEGESRVQELSQMMNGQEASEISKEHAKEMLSRVQ